MTKVKTATEMIEAIASEPTPEQVARTLERDEYYTRDSALGYAMNFHKNNGGMMTAPQLVEYANVFLAFLKGETK